MFRHEAGLLSLLVLVVLSGMYRKFCDNGAKLALLGGYEEYFIVIEDTWSFEWQLDIENT